MELLPGRTDAAAGRDRLRMIADLRRIARETGTSDFFAVVPGDIRVYLHLMREGLFMDVVSQDTGESAVEAGLMDMAKGSPETRADRTGGKYVAEPKEGYGGRADRSGRKSDEELAREEGASAPKQSTTARTSETTQADSTIAPKPQVIVLPNLPSGTYDGQRRPSSGPE